MRAVDGGEMMARLINVNMHNGIFATNWMTLNKTEYRKGHL